MTGLSLDDIAARAGVTWFDYQAEALARAAAQAAPQRLCLYYRTGAGKTLTALAAVALWGHDEALVIAPPSTHLGWQDTAARMGMVVQTMSHAKFRMKGTKLRRDMAVIADEFHLFGGHKGQGWKKLDRLARGLTGPLILASATPNYNDAERVYCIQHVLDPHACKGGYLEFIYRHCTTEQNPFGMEPIVTGFQSFVNAADFLASLPGVEYLPDEVVYTIEDVQLPWKLTPELDSYGYDRRNHRVIASLMEERHTRTFQRLVDLRGMICPDVWLEILEVYRPGVPLLIYANHATVAVAAAKTFEVSGVGGVRLVTGKTTKPKKDEYLGDFKRGDASILIGTASLATGTDGLDKMCDTLLILDDTDDDALRRQLIGRIMPRGEDTDASKKQVIRLLQ